MTTTKKDADLTSKRQDEGEGKLPQETGVKFNGEPNPKLNNSETDPQFKPEDSQFVEMTGEDDEVVTEFDDDDVQASASRMPVGVVDSQLPNTNVGVQMQKALGTDPADYGYSINFPPNVAREVKHTDEDLRKIQANSLNAHVIEAVIVPVPSELLLSNQQRTAEIAEQLPGILRGNDASAKAQLGQKRAADARKAAKKAKEARQ